jgi:hypothetical protein
VEEVRQKFFEIALNLAVLQEKAAGGHSKIDPAPDSCEDIGLGYVAMINSAPQQAPCPMNQNAGEKVFDSREVLDPHCKLISLL